MLLEGPHQTDPAVAAPVSAPGDRDGIVARKRAVRRIDRSGPAPPGASLAGPAYAQHAAVGNATQSLRPAREASCRTAASAVCRAHRSSPTAPPQIHRSHPPRLQSIRASSRARAVCDSSAFQEHRSRLRPSRGLETCIHSIPCGFVALT